MKTTGSEDNRKWRQRKAERTGSEDNGKQRQQEVKRTASAENRKWMQQEEGVITYTRIVNTVEPR